MGWCQHPLPVLVGVGYLLAATSFRLCFAVPQMLLGGLLPFAGVYVELHYVFASIWTHKVYTIYSILLIVFVILVVVTAFVTIAMVRACPCLLADSRAWTAHMCSSCYCSNGTMGNPTAASQQRSVEKGFGPSFFQRAGPRRVGIACDTSIAPARFEQVQRIV